MGSADAVAINYPESPHNPCTNLPSRLEGPFFSIHLQLVDPYTEGAQFGWPVPNESPGAPSGTIQSNWSRFFLYSLPNPPRFGVALPLAKARSVAHRPFAGTGLHQGLRPRCPQISRLQGFLGLAYLPFYGLRLVLGRSYLSSYCQALVLGLCVVLLPCISE
jgi:hypothetical protein